MKYFTEEQLAEEVKPLSERAKEALTEGRLDDLHYLLNQMAVGHAGVGTLGIQWVGRMLGEIRNEMGEAFLDEMLGEIAQYVMKPYARELSDGDEKGVFSELILIYRSQHPAVIVPKGETDEEKQL